MDVMLKVKDIVSYFEKICPFSLCEEWDNTGLLIGDENAGVTRILVCLDVDEFVAQEAADKKCELIVSHHPVIFHPLKKICANSCEGILIKNGISAVSAHTNLDVANGGLNDYLAEKLGLENTEILVPAGEFDGKTVGYGRFAKLKKPEKLIDIAKKCAEILGAESLRYMGDDDRIIEKIAVNSGGGASMADACFDKNIGLYISGDFKYSNMRDCAQRGLCVIDAGHYETEHIVCEWFEKALSKQFDVQIIKSEKNTNVIKYLH